MNETPSQSSVELDTTAKGLVVPKVKVYAPHLIDGYSGNVYATDDPMTLADTAVRLLCKTVDDLTVAGIPTVYDAAVVTSMRAYAQLSPL